MSLWKYSWFRTTDELIEQMKAHLPDGVKSIFISSVANMNITQLKDMLWNALQE
jgi:GTP-binding protein